MNKEELIEYAKDLKMHQGYNCAQAITCALKEETNLSEEELKSLSAGFCAGMGNLKASCGALIGANIILGLKTKGESTLILSKQLIERFEELSGALVCKDLKTITNGKPLCPCDKCVENAMKAYLEITSK